MENLPNSAQRGLRERYYIFPVGLSVNDAAAMSAHSPTSLKKRARRQTREVLHHHKQAWL